MKLSFGLRPRAEAGDDLVLGSLALGSKLIAEFQLIFDESLRLNANGLLFLEREFRQADSIPLTLLVLHKIADFGAALKFQISDTQPYCSIG
jgi:hypothetical protein